MNILNHRTLLALALSFIMTYIPNVVLAEVGNKLVTTQEAVAGFSRHQAEQRIRHELDRKDVQEQLRMFGVDAEDAKSRLASLSDQEIQEMTKQMNASQYGASVGGVLVLVVLVLLIIYLAKRI